MVLPKTELPIETIFPKLYTSLESNPTVLTAEAGAGKSTIVPLRLLEQTQNESHKIILLEPRRVAARSIAARMADLLQEPLGQTIGYRTRTDRKISKQNRIEVMTDGIFTRKLQHDPTLTKISTVIFDEFHERGTNIELALALSLDIHKHLRPDLKLLVMSATIDAKNIANLLSTDTNPAPSLRCTGRTFPLTIHWKPLKQSVRRSKYHTYKPKPKPVEAVMSIIDEALLHPGNVLIFLPGVGETKRTIKKLQEHLYQHEIDIYPLYGSLSPEEQTKAITTNVRRTIIVATDIAETSLTVEGTRIVIDAGLSRKPEYDPATDLTKLATKPNSKASAEQRAGRAGRLAPGVVYRLWSKTDHAKRPKYDRPEIQEIEPSQLLLEAAAWGSDLEEMKFLALPDKKRIQRGKKTLSLLGLIQTNNGKISITPKGRETLQLPLPPRLSAMVQAFAKTSDNPLSWTAITLAALLTERDICTGKERPTDLWSRIEALEGIRTIEGQNYHAIQQVKKQRADLAKRIGIQPTDIEPQFLGTVLAHAYPDRIAQNKGILTSNGSARFLLRNGSSVHTTGSLALESMIVIAEMTGTKKAQTVRKAAAIEPAIVEEKFDTQIQKNTLLYWDEEQNNSAKKVEKKLGSITFTSNRATVEPGAEATALLLEQIKQTNLEILSWTPRSRQLQARVAFLHAHANISLKKIDDQTITNEADELFIPYLTEATHRKHLEALDIYQILKQQYSWEQQQQLEKLAPEKLRLPSGKNIFIEYQEKKPAVEIRAQEAYGIQKNPTICNVPITFTLLSPAQRPIQTTSDLTNFWNGSWKETRKEMKSKYPKHDWPENP